jgi:hypothetical protein
MRMKELVGLEDKVKTIEDFLNNLVAESAFVTFASVPALQKIVASDSYLTMQELGMDKEMGGIEGREEATKALYSEEPRSKSDYPKYGMLTAKDTFLHLLKDSDPVYHYGPVLLIWKKASIMDRTTMTIGSSFDFGECFFKCPTFVNACSITCLHGSSYAGHRSRMGSRESVIKFEEKIKKGELKAAYDLADAFDGGLGYEDYELQINGPLALSKDVEAVQYFSMGSDDDDKLFATLKDQIRKMGVQASELEG